MPTGVYLRIEKRGGWLSNKKGKTYEQMYGRERATEIKVVLSQRHLGQRNSVESYRKAAIALSKYMKGRPKELHPSWQGGKSFVSYGFEFPLVRGKIRERDGNRCRWCGVEEKGLQVHHIDGDKKNNLGINLITLCVRCHGKFRRIKLILLLRVLACGGIKSCFLDLGKDKRVQKE